MNARFAAVALSSCLFLVLISQLLPLPSLSTLLATDTHGSTSHADRSGSPVVVAAVQAPQAVESPQASEPPRAIEAPRAVVPRAVEPPQASETPRAAEVPQTAEVVHEAQAAPPEPASATPQISDTSKASQAQPVPEPSDTSMPPRAVETQHAEQDAKPQQAADATPALAPQMSDTHQTDAADVAAHRPVEATTSEPAPAATVTESAADQPEVSQPDKKIDVASADAADMLQDVQPLPEHPAELPPGNPLAPLNSAVAVDDCLVEGCVDRYLWALYQRAPKEDKVRVDEQRMVAVKRKGKLVMVARTFSRLVDEDFTWKDQKASEKAGMPIDTYVIGGMDTDFRLKLFRILHAADIAGLAPGITSAFRDDYRQSIASGLKAANNRSFHGGSTRGGYGHGLAADVVSVKGATRVERYAATETLWKWIDVNAQQFGIGRPYLGYDPPHLAPTDGDEWARHHHEPGVRVAAGKKKVGKTTQLAAHHARGAAKRVASAKSKAGTDRAARTAPYRTAQAKLHG